MDLGYLKTSHIPFNVFYGDSNRKKNRLPSEKRNFDIIKGITFGELLKYVKKKDENNINSWLGQHENKLKKHLSIMETELKQEERDKYCTNLNYILDFVVQAVNNFDKSKFFESIHYFDKNSINILNSFASLNCERNIYNSDDKNLYIKKIMYDLCDDMEYMLSDKNIPSGTPCSRMIGRIRYRSGILGRIYNTVSDKSIFYLNKNCNLSIIGEKFSSLSCNKKPIVPPTVSVTEPQTLTALSSSGRDLSEPRETEDVENPESVDPVPDDLTFSLPVNDDPPKLDTTYAAASLAGISLFGTILYKYGPFRSRLNSLRGARNGSNIFPLDNNVYDANIMNNFEYLQTGIPNDEYQLGYGSVTDY
ncbi:hypothetical protein PVNG_06200 [Plasmodium vivax North Korean]|uniref:VIR protein n=1 Tax=Plasmodium vivax North Korean TaxID=1035514 RepID=A0A0J9U1C0_PLAVI|nr:hypothetical protein PVNG_06200 [Plasmodium vivax North Korean]